MTVGIRPSPAPGPTYDPFDPRVHESYPGDLYAWLRSERPVYRNDERDFWALSRFDDVQAALRDWKTFSTAGPRGVHIDSRPAIYGAGDFLELDPPRHTELRNLVRQPFSLRAVAELEPDVRRRTTALLAPVLAAGGGDLAAEVCWPLAFELTAEMLGIPREDLERVDELVRRFSAVVPGSPDLPSDATAAGDAAYEYVVELLSRDRGRLRGIVRDIADARSRGEVSEAEAPGIPMLFFGAAIETPATACANLLRLLAQHPDQRRLLLDGDVELPVAIEELFRYESPLQCLARTTTEPVTLHGAELPEGATVLLAYGAANRDERRWPGADELQLTRERKRNVAFGEGIHHCIGAPLARLQARVVVELVTAAAPEYEVCGPVAYLHRYSDWGVLRLPVSW